jgi:hypothetical protein
MYIYIKKPVEAAAAESKGLASPSTHTYGTVLLLVVTYAGRPTLYRWIGHVRSVNSLRVCNCC